MKVRWPAKTTFVTIAALSVGIGLSLIRVRGQNVLSSSNSVSQTNWVGSDKFGLCDGFSSKTISDDITDTKSLGFGFGRPLGDVFSQNTIEKNGKYDFSTPDAVVKNMQEAGISIFGTLFPIGIPKIPQTTNLDSFSSYVSALVDRYNGDGKNDMPGLTTKITNWQVGIEPFCGTLNETCYKNFSDLVKTAYEAAKSIDSSLMISPGGPGPIYTPSGGTDSQASSIFKYFFEQDGANYMDFFNFHYLVGAKAHDIKKYYSYWKKYVPSDKEIWLSETGSRDVGDKYTISSNATTEASWIKTHLSDSFQSGITKIFWCRAEHSFSDMPKVVEALQNYAKKYGGTPSGSVTKRQTQQNVIQDSNIPTQGSQPSTEGTVSGKCGDNKCDSIEQQTGGCPKDCQ